MKKSTKITVMYLMVPDASDSQTIKVGSYCLTAFQESCAAMKNNTVNK